MRYFVSSGKWQHKPGDSVPLQFDGTMSNSVDWLCEGILASGYECDSSYVYDSAIRYIIYRDPDYYEEENNSVPDIPKVDVVS